MEGLVPILSTARSPKHCQKKLLNIKLEVALEYHRVFSKQERGRKKEKEGRKVG